jgi:hypothetical protein
MKPVIFSDVLGSAFTVSVKGTLYSTPLLSNGGYNHLKWTKVIAVSEVKVAELECVVSRLVLDSILNFEDSKTNIINNIMFNQVEVINY